MTMNLRDRFVHEEDGFSLAELAVYAVLSVVILTIVGNLLISAFNTRTQVQNLTTASSTGQLIARSVEEGVRNASGPLSETDTDRKRGIKSEPWDPSAGQLLRARVAIGASNGTVQWQCQAWFFSTQTESVYSATSTAGAIDNPGSFSIVDGNHVAASGSAKWILLGSGVEKDDEAAQFFGPGPESVTLRYQVTSNDVSLVLIPKTVVKRVLAAGGTGPTICF